MQQEVTFGHPSGIKIMSKDNPRQFGGQVFFSHLPLVTDKKNKRAEFISSVIRSGIYFDGPQNKTLEKKLSRMLPKGFITTLGSGHDSLMLALTVLKLKPTDEVIFPVNAYPTAFPIALSGAKMVPCDVDKNGQIDIRKLEKRISKNTKAIVIVHLYGLTTDIEKIKKICGERKIALIEDCAQSLGTTFSDRPLGTFGDISCFSFYPTKNLGSLGDGGAIWTNQKKYYNYFIKAKSYGERKKYESEFISGHSRLPEIQAAILNLYAATLKHYFNKRKSLFKLYKERFESLSPYVRVLVSHPKSDPVPHILVIEAKDRNKLITFLKRRGIPTLIHYPKPIHLVRAFSYLGYKKGDFPMAEFLSDRIVTLPFHQKLSERTLNYICESIKEFYKLNT